MLYQLFGSFKNAANGLLTTWHEELNFKIDSLVSVFIFASFFYIDLSAVEMAILTFAVGLTLAAEVANTAIEDLCDKVEPNDDWQIGKVKDTMSGFVLIIAMTCAAVAILIYSRHI